MHTIPDLAARTSTSTLRVTFVCGDGDNHVSGTGYHDYVFLHAGNDYGTGGARGDVIRGHQGVDRISRRPRQRPTVRQQRRRLA